MPEKKKLFKTEVTISVVVEEDAEESLNYALITAVIDCARSMDVVDRYEVLNISDLPSGWDGFDAPANGNGEMSIADHLERDNVERLGDACK